MARRSINRERAFDVFGRTPVNQPRIILIKLIYFHEDTYEFISTRREIRENPQYYRINAKNWQSFLLEEEEEGVGGGDVLAPRTNRTRTRYICIYKKGRGLM